MTFMTRALLCSALVALCLVPALQSQQRPGGEITIAAAADLQFAMQEIAAKFQQDTGQQVKVIYGSSGNFFQQIENGAPFDMFFSANLDFPRKLEADGMAEAGSLYPYARGRIVIWVPNVSQAQVSSGLKGLLETSVKKIAIANPQHAPYGQAAVAAMQSEKVYERVKDKLVLGENISQAASFAVSGSADVGIIAMSLAVSENMKGKGHFAEIPESEYPPIEQGCVVIARSRNKELAHQFLAFMKSTAVGELMQRYGFDRPTSRSGH